MLLMNSYAGFGIYASNFICHIFEGFSKDTSPQMQIPVSRDMTEETHKKPSTYAFDEGKSAVIGRGGFPCTASDISGLYPVVDEEVIKILSGNNHSA